MLIYAQLLTEEDMLWSAPIYLRSVVRYCFCGLSVILLFYYFLLFSPYEQQQQLYMDRHKQMGFFSYRARVLQHLYHLNFRFPLLLPPSPCVRSSMTLTPRCPVRCMRIQPKTRLLIHTIASLHISKSIITCFMRSIGTQVHILRGMVMVPEWYSSCMYIYTVILQAQLCSI